MDLFRFGLMLKIYRADTRLPDIMIEMDLVEHEYIKMVPMKPGRTTRLPCPQCNVRKKVGINLNGGILI